MNKDYLRVETGEPYQPVRLTCHISDKPTLLLALNQLGCIKFNKQLNIWQWQRIKEVADLRLLSELNLADGALPEVTLGLLTIENDQKMHIDFCSYERAYLAAPYFYRWLGPDVVQLIHVDLYNNFTDKDNLTLSSYDNFFHEHELVEQLKKQQMLFEKELGPLELITEQTILSYLEKHADFINQQPLLKQERFLLNLDGQNKKIDEAKMVFFTCALMVRELVARKHWLGDKNYNLQQAAFDSAKLT